MTDDEIETAVRPESMRRLFRTITVQAVANKRRGPIERRLDQWLPWRDEVNWEGLLRQHDELWGNPTEFAADGGPDVWKGQPQLMMFQIGVVFGIEYERAYPTGQQDEWPVPIEEREDDDNYD